MFSYYEDSNNAKRSHRKDCIMQSLTPDYELAKLEMKSRSEWTSTNPYFVSYRSRCELVVELHENNDFRTQWLAENLTTTNTETN